MGGNFSVINETEKNKLTQDIMNNIQTSITNQTTANATSNQNVNISLSNSTLSGCDLSVRQVVDSNISALGHLSTNQLQDLSTDIGNSLQNTLDSILNQKNSGLNIVQGNLGVTVQKIGNDIKTNLSNTIQNSIQNIVTTTTDVNQSVTLIGNFLKCENSKITIDQEAAIKSLANSITDAIVQDLDKAAVSNGITNNAGAWTTQENVGISLLGLTVILIIAGALMFFLKRGKIGGNKSSDGSEEKPKSSFIGPFLILLIVLAILSVLIAFTAPKRKDSNVANTIFTCSIIGLIIAVGMISLFLYFKFKRKGSPVPEEENDSAKRKKKK